MTKEKIIMYDSAEAATYVTNIEGWIDKDRRFFGKGEDGERMARYSSCTHRKCDCGNTMERSYTKCSSCRYVSSVERYNKFPFREWDRKEPVCTWDGDTYFFSEESLMDYMDNNGIETIDLLLCEPNNWQSVDEDYWSDMMPENSDGELPIEMQKALNELNRVISTLPPQSYSPGKIRTRYTLDKAK